MVLPFTLNRAHNNQDALNALRLIAEAGFNNMTADLIYGVPGVSDDQWISDILALTDRKIPHILDHPVDYGEFSTVAKQKQSFPGIPSCYEWLEK